MSDSDKSKGSTGDYLRLVFFDPITLTGLIVLITGMVLVAISDPSAPVQSPMLGGSLMLVGTVLFALGYTRAQWGLKRWKGE
ncbi:hypothetical protein SAMN05421858_3955 [Haladaptatus litoreus]|uniref:Uncharacterized protein n=1 Tax=Haladaptatus litoreus TaxID=553468 RepID=A0A1N7E1Y1_9EURY|nr:hypothetical protein SAMN05421858_3955 [Haladaptatus litoreus]